ncbi:MAG: hypothetical protein IKP05_03525 [Alphaproteobacteria bacterium]|nr:hypothetical protein [Alphaproteobacteria bacterium]
MRTHAFCAVFVFGALYGLSAHAAVSSLNTESSVRPISQYGLIQNVQDYSTNPFWTKNSPYNQKFPTAVYVDGPELNTADCQSTVGSLVSVYCSQNNNCIGMQLSDIRPFVMLQLARMPGHNYASACAGYIDSEFDAYVEKYSIAMPTGTVAFPTGTVANPNYDAPEFKLENPYEIKDGTWNGEEWKKEKRERKKELQELQSINGAGSEHLARADFPTTFADLSFSDQMAIKATAYEPYADKSAYRGLDVETEEEFLRRTNYSNQSEYCARNPNSPECKNNIQNAQADINTIAMSCKTTEIANDGIIHLCLM